MVERKNQIHIPAKNCTGCHACYSICPNSSIQMIEDSEGFEEPIINNDTCASCGLCRKICDNRISKIVNENNPKAYAAYNKDEETRLNSSSGGIFSLIASKVVKDGGVVFGASFDSDLRVIHTYAETEGELKQFRGSKYVQSKIGETYKQAEKFLNEGRLCLFSGTPCQISGLKAYLGRDDDNLLTHDIICHGVPSYKVFKKYIEYHEKKYNNKIENISFRSKLYGWEKSSVTLQFANNKSYNLSWGGGNIDDLFMRCYLQYICMRLCCYKCEFKSINRNSDITLADFWGVNKIIPELNDNKGISLIIINTKRGGKILNDIKPDIIYKEVDIDSALRYNTSAVSSADYNKNRLRFFKELDNTDFNKLADKYCSQISTYRLKQIFKKIRKEGLLYSCVKVIKRAIKIK